MSYFNTIENERTGSIRSVDGNDSRSAFLTKESFSIDGSSLREVARKYMPLKKLERDLPSTSVHVVFDSGPGENTDVLHDRRSAIVNFCATHVYQVAEIDGDESADQCNSFVEQVAKDLVDPNVVAVIFVAQKTAEIAAASVKEELPKEVVSVKTQVSRLSSLEASEIVGVVLFALHNDSLAEIWHVGVHQDYRRLSIGRLLFFLVEYLCTDQSSDHRSDVNMVARMPKFQDPEIDLEAFISYKWFLRCLFFFEENESFSSTAKLQFLEGRLDDHFWYHVYHMPQRFSSGFFMKGYHLLEEGEGTVPDNDLYEVFSEISQLAARCFFGSPHPICQHSNPSQYDGVMHHVEEQFNVPLQEFLNGGEDSHLTCSFNVVLSDPDPWKGPMPPIDGTEPYYPDSFVAEHLFSTYRGIDQAAQPLLSSEDYRYGDHENNSLCLFRCLGNVLLGGPEKLMLIRAFLSFFMKCILCMKKELIHQLFPPDGSLPNPPEAWCPIFTNYFSLLRKRIFKHYEYCFKQNQKHGFLSKPDANGNQPEQVQMNAFRDYADSPYLQWRRVCHRMKILYLINDSFRADLSDVYLMASVFRCRFHQMEVFWLPDLFPPETTETGITSRTWTVSLVKQHHRWFLPNMSPAGGVPSESLFQFTLMRYLKRHYEVLFKYPFSEKKRRRTETAELYTCNDYVSS